MHATNCITLPVLAHSDHRQTSTKQRTTQTVQNMKQVFQSKVEKNKTSLFCNYGLLQSVRRYNKQQTYCKFVTTTADFIYNLLADAFVGRSTGHKEFIQ